VVGGAAYVPFIPREGVGARCGGSFKKAKAVLLGSTAFVERVIPLG